MRDVAHRDTDGWDGILNEGEEILWQGRPDPGFRPKSIDLFGVMFGMFFTGVPIFWMDWASEESGVFWILGLLFVFVGLRQISNALFGNWFSRRYSFYTLTNERALIATQMPFRPRTLNSYPITTDSPLALETGRFDTVTFATNTQHTDDSTVTTPIGFEDIEDGRTVFQLMTRIQKGETP